MVKPLHALALLLSAVLPCSAGNIRLSVPAARSTPVIAPFLAPTLHLGVSPLAPLTPLSSPLLNAAGMTSLISPSVLVAPIPSVIPVAAVAAPGKADPAVSVQEGLQGVVDQLQTSHADYAGQDNGLNDMYHGAGQKSAVAAFVINDEGVKITGRAAEYYQQVRRLVEQYKGKIDMGESLDVMDDSYGDVWAKLKAIEAIAQSRQIEKHNTHLEETLIWVDGIMKQDGRTIAVNTHRVYFHHAKNPQSEIAEGTRRAAGYLEGAVRDFSKGGKAEQALGKIDEVVLAFDTRGYAEVKSFLKAREAEIKKAYGPRFKFAYLDELTQMPKDIEATRAELNTLAKKYQGKGLEKIIEGVIYSRYVGLLLELRTLDHYYTKGYQILQSGRELFDAQGHYVTEIDAVVRSPEGKVAIVEAKSARVQIPVEDALEEKVIKKLDTYSKNRAALEAEIGYHFDEVVFSFDVGRNQALADFLKSQEAALSKRYGFPVSFMFVETSAPQQQHQHLKKKRR